jgi:hypothetical protein
MSGAELHWVDVRDKLGFLRRLMFELAGNAQISLEGDLSCCHFPEDSVVTRNETSRLKRNARAPRQDFVVLRLTRETAGPIFREVMAAELRGTAISVQIERNGIVELGAYDDSDPGCIVIGPSIRLELLRELKETHVLRDFMFVPQAVNQ